MSAPRSLPDDGLLLHIGVPKTGTTSLQACLALSRSSLAQAGVLYPGTASSHVAAVRRPLGWPSTPRELERDTRRWDALVRAARAHVGRVVVSAESLAVADEATAAGIVAALGHPHTEVAVTVRSLEHVLPSAWQEDVKAGLSVPFTDWLDDTCRGPGVARAAPSAFWVVHDHAAVVDRWSAVVGADRVTVVVIDQRDRDGVFRAFGHLIGLDDAALRPELAERQNRSLTAAESELLRRLNERLDRSEEESLRRRPIPAPAIWALLDGRTPDVDEQRLAVPTHHLEQIRPISEDIVRRLRASGAAVIGDLDLLVPAIVDAPATGGAPRRPPDVLPMDVAVRLLQGLLQRDPQLP